MPPNTAQLQAAARALRTGLRSRAAPAAAAAASAAAARPTFNPARAQHNFATLPISAPNPGVPNALTHRPPSALMQRKKNTNLTFQQWAWHMHHNNQFGAFTKTPREMYHSVIDVAPETRPDPAAYTHREHIAKHRKEFEQGGARLNSVHEHQRYNIDAATGQVKPKIGFPGQFFSTPKAMHWAVQEGGGDPDATAKILGKNTGDFDSGAVLVNADASEFQHDLMPTGRAPGTNLNWVPGGDTFNDGKKGITETTVAGSYAPKGLIHQVVPAKKY